MDENNNNKPTMIFARKGIFVSTVVINFISMIANFVLMLRFYAWGDYVWFSAFLSFFVISTLFNMAVTALDHPRPIVRFCWMIMCILQIKPLLDTLDFLWKPMRTNTDLLAFRSKAFYTNVIQSLPATFLLSYVLMLDLHSRINEQLLAAITLLAVLSFSLATTHFTAANNTMCVFVLVLLNIVSQCIFRMLAVCSVCVRFRVVGVAVIFVLWLISYFFGPKSALPLWRRMCGCGPQRSAENSQPVVNDAKLALIKILVSPLHFFIVVDELNHVRDKLVKAHHCYRNTTFMIWRSIENFAMVLWFVLAPHKTGEVEYEEWLSHPTRIAIVCGSALVVLGATWGAISAREEDDEEIPAPPKGPYVQL